MNSRIQILSILINKNKNKILISDLMLNDPQLRAKNYSKIIKLKI